MPASVPLAALYLRVSSEEQRERQTIETQRDFGTRWCALHEIPIRCVYEDDGVSGTVPLDERPGGARLLEAARQGQVSIVYIYKIDRLGRGARPILNAVATLEALGCQVRSLTEPFDTSTPSGRFLLTILSGVAELERDTIIERSVAGSRRLAREGIWLGGVAPYGYRVVGKGKERRLSVCEELVAGGSGLTEAGVVREVYRLLIEERKTCYMIGQHLDMLGVPPVYTRDKRQITLGGVKRPTSGRWSITRVRNMLASPIYKGVYVYGKRSRRGEPVEGRVPAIVSEEMWERAQEQLHQNMLRSPRHGKTYYLLRGLIRCGICGNTFTGRRYAPYHPGVKLYYCCSGRITRNGPGNTRCRAKQICGDLEDVVWSDIEGFLRDPGPVLRELKAQGQEGKAVVERLAERIAGWERALERSKGERDTVVGLFRRGRIDEEALDRQLDELDATEARLREQLEEARAAGEGQARVRQAVEEAGSLLAELRSRLDGELTWEVKRSIVELLVVGIVVDMRAVEWVSRKGELRTRREDEVTISYCFPAPERENAIATRKGLGPGECIPSGGPAAR